MIAKAGTALLIATMLVCGRCGADEVLSESCKANGFAVVTRPDGALHIAYAEWRASAPDVTNPRYDEASFLQNFTAHLDGCKWQVEQKGQHGIEFMTINARDGALLSFGVAE
jgi:hypothetical protein